MKKLLLIFVVFVCALLALTSCTVEDLFVPGGVVQTDESQDQHKDESTDASYKYTPCATWAWHWDNR